MLFYLKFYICYREVIINVLRSVCSLILEELDISYMNRVILLLCNDVRKTDGRLINSLTNIHYCNSSTL